jgi:antitoxin HigA-1
MATVHHHAPEHPGVLLRDSVLPDLHLSVSQAARDLAVTRQTLHRILAGSAAITPDMAARLEKLCGISSEFWLERQHRHELERVKAAIAPILGRIPYHRLSKAVMNKVGEPE